MTENIFLPLLSDFDDKNSPLKNRIRKNYRHLRKWGKRTETNCFRIYDRDIKEYPLAIDFYDGRFCVHYFASKLDGDEPRQDLLTEATNALCSLFEVNENSIFWKTRIKREKLEQYEKKSAKEQSFIVQEYGIKFEVNLLDYIDTGLFLDHRETRQLVAKLSSGKNILNLFAYTCSFSVHAAAQGALHTTSVDMSNTYTEWGKRNFLLNSLSLKTNEIIREDCFKFLDYHHSLYDIIVIDPPTTSRSKKMDQMFDIQEDYIVLIKRSLKFLHPHGTMIFSTNSRRFKFDESHFPEYKIKPINTIPLDFHNQNIHHTWLISKKLLFFN